MVAVQAEVSKTFEHIAIMQSARVTQRE